jgi:hypothetical protein
MPEHPELDVLPEWPIRTIAVLAAVDHGPPRSRSRGHGAWNRRTGVAQAEPGTYKGMHLVVDDLVSARDLLVGRGGGRERAVHFGPEGRAEGMHPERQSYGRFVTFNDPDGNNWLVQEVTERSPGLQ